MLPATFTTRRVRLRDNKVEDKFEYLNKKAGEIAQKAKKQFPTYFNSRGSSTSIFNIRRRYKTR